MNHFDIDLQNLCIHYRTKDHISTFHSKMALKRDQSELSLIGYWINLALIRLEKKCLQALQTRQYLVETAFAN